MEDELIPEAIRPGMILPMDSEKLLYILNEQKKNCCKIKSECKGTGFFLKLILENLKILPVLMTCNHVLDEEAIKIGNSINYTLDNDKKEYTIKIDNSRLVYTNPLMDFTIIQLYKNEFIDIESFLTIDVEALKDKKKDDYKGNSIYLLHYPKGERANYSPGTINSITEDTNEIFHSCSSESGSSGGPLINQINFKLIGIHKGYKNGKNFNSGFFIKPIVEDIFKHINIKNIIFQDFESNTVKKSSENIKNSSRINSLYYLVLIFGIIKQFSLITFTKILFNFIEELFNIKNYVDIRIFIFLSFLIDIFCSIILKLFEILRIPNEVIFFISMILHILPGLPIKILSSSFFHIFPFFNNRTINELIKGEIIANFVYIPFDFLTNLHELKGIINKGIFFIIIGIIVIIDIIGIILIIKNCSEFDKLKKEEESNTIIKFNYFSKKKYINSFLFINYSITFSIVPIILLYYSKRIFVYIFIISDALGRFLGSKLGEKSFVRLIWARILLGINIIVSLEEDGTKYSLLIKIFILGLFSGALTSIGYYIPVKKENKSEKISLIYYIKQGKYYILYLLMSDEKNIKEIKNN